MNTFQIVIFHLIDSLIAYKMVFQFFNKINFQERKLNVDGQSRREIYCADD